MGADGIRRTGRTAAAADDSNRDSAGARASRADRARRGLDDHRSADAASAANTVCSEPGAD